ncbi:MAG: AAA family ATPase [Rubrivivax sp.]
MSAVLLERDALLQQLQRMFDGAATGQGRVAWIAGEAGIGKTSLLRRFVRQPDVDATRPLWGACDPLFTPRPLGPLHDMAGGLGGGVAAALARHADRVEVFAAVRDALGRTPRCLVIDDLHWADEATLDLLADLGRRIDDTRTLLLASYRDDEVSPQHPLRRVLGALPGAARLTLAPLSTTAVRQLAGLRRVDVDALHRHTGGNPFFVTEWLASLGTVGSGGRDDALGVPPTVRDAVLARAARLPVGAQAALAAAAVVGPRIEPALLGQVAGVDAAAVMACVDAGVLRESGPALEFRHELARQAVLASLSATRQRALHAHTLQVLEAAAPGEDLARLAHHAEGAGDATAVRRLAPAAARQALAAGARSEARAQFARAVRHADGLPIAEHAALLQAHASACSAVQRFHEGITSGNQALALWRSIDDPEREADMLCQLASLMVQVGCNAEAETAVRQAVDLVSEHPGGASAARAWRAQAWLHMLARENDAAIHWGREALLHCEASGDAAAIGITLNTLGAATMHLDDAAGCALLERSRTIGLQLGHDGMVVDADSNLGSASGELHRFERAERWLARGVAYALEREIEVDYLLSWQALCWLHLGRWEAAGDQALALLGPGHESTIARNMAQIALGRLRARRGDAGVWTALDDALRLALASGHLQRIAPVRAARAEAAWLDGERQRCLDEAAAAWAPALAHRHPWFVGELAYWRHIAGDTTIELPACAATPFALQCRGDWAGAAAAWRDLACPYEADRALAEGDANAQRQALSGFDRLGARPMADTLRRRLQVAGVRGLPRGPRRATRAHPLGLTGREQQVLALLCEGLRNAEIAARLSRSVRTVDHHVAALYAKLGVDSRHAAVLAAQRHGLIAPPPTAATTA